MEEIRSFVLICNDLNISNFESINLTKASVAGITIEQWADMDIDKFVQNSKNFLPDEKSLLVQYLKICEELLS